jgi:general L-amino acid transport system permease protein
MNQLKWLQKNLFNNWYNSILTVISLILIFQVTKKLGFWIFKQAQWEVIKVNFPLFLFGRFPQESWWRIGIIFVIISSLITITLIGLFKPQKIIKTQVIKLLITWLAPAWLLSFPVIFWLISGGLGLKIIPTNLWNGLFLTLLMAVISIILSLPIGILLALGRTSNLLVIRWSCLIYIELIRGLPLIGILFIAQVMLPLFLPPELRLDRLFRGIAGLVLFSAAYMAENVRGGLQAIPKGQIEAAKALGLHPPLVIILIVLPQALKAVIPAIVGQFIGLFKDTSLLSLVGLVELTGISRSILAQPQFIGKYAEVYLFVGLIYWCFCYFMSLASRRLEQQLNN